MIDIDSTLSEVLMQRIRQLASRGTIKTANDAGAVQTVQVQVSPNEIYDAVPRLIDFGFTSNVPVGTDAVVVFFGGNRSNGVVIGTNKQGIRITGLAPGEVAVYDAFGKSIQLKSNGIVINANNQPVTLNNATTTTVNSTDTVVNGQTITLKATDSVYADTPLFACSGDIVDNVGSQSSSLADLRGAHDGHDHQVKNVQGGTATIITTGPNLTV